MVAQGTVPVLARLLDPEAPLVYLEGFSPLAGLSAREWTGLALPLGRSSPNETVRARRITFDLLLPTERFLALAPELEDHCMYCAQVEQAPPPAVQFDQLHHPAARMNWYRRVGFILSFDLPHSGEDGQVAARDSAVRAAALTRLDK
jgi:hypothetical protein